MPEVQRGGARDKPDDASSRASRPSGGASQDAAAFLVELDGLEQRLKVSFAEALVALALNHFEEDRADGVLGEDLQQNAGVGAAVDQDAPPRKLLQRLPV